MTEEVGQEELIGRLSFAWAQCMQADWVGEEQHGPNIVRARARGDGICQGVAVAIAICSGSPDEISIADAVRFGSGIARARLAAHGQP